MSSYNAKDLVVLEGLDAVRMRPGMYIGSTGSKGLHHILWEIIDNSIDELTNGYGNKVTIKLHKDKSATVIDNGRGVPTDPHPKLKKSGVEVVFTQLHAGGKFSDKNYNFSGGLHGVGASVTNALSEYCEVTVCRNNKKHYIRFESIEKNGKIISGSTIIPLKLIGNTKDTGTCVHFLPDKRVFKEIDFSLDIIAKKLRETAYLNKGIIIELIDERVGEKLQFCYEGGIRDYVVHLNEDKKCNYFPPIFIEGDFKDIFVSLSFQHTDLYTENIYSYVNNIPTPEGGWHEVGLKSALTKVLNDCGRKTGLIKEKDANLLGEDYREGLTAVLQIKMKNVQFEGQTKTKLGNTDVKAKVEGFCVQKLDELFSAKNNHSILQAIIEKGKSAEKVRLAAKRAKEFTRAKNSIENSMLVGKLSNCSGKNAEINEIFLVEGDSAGGSAKQGRDRFFQAILSLKGKPLNAEKKRIDQVLANDEIRTIIGAIGTGIGTDFKIDNLKYNKIIILSDADQDGAHIRAILITFFYRYMRELITNGNLYIGLPPLYKVTNAGNEHYCYSDEELETILSGIKGNYSLQRYKGLGEMNPEQLWDTTLDPKTRSMIRISVDDAVEANDAISTWMGDDVASRKNYIITNANFNKND